MFQGQQNMTQQNQVNIDFEINLTLKKSLWKSLKKTKILFDEAFMLSVHMLPVVKSGYSAGLVETMLMYLSTPDALYSFLSKGSSHLMNVFMLQYSR